MPELPEVEILRRLLLPEIQNRTILDLQVLKERGIRPHDSKSFRARLKGSRIQSLSRRAKYLIFQLSAPDGMDFPMLAHLGMTGRFQILPSPLPNPPRHAVALMDLGDCHLAFLDMRGFGGLSLDESPLASLGPEPWDSSWTVEQWSQALKGSRQPIKPKLLDQHLVAGIGNIYASEILHAARISPEKSCQDLRTNEIRRLHQSIPSILEQAIRLGESLKLDLRGEGGGDGLFYFGSARGTEGTQKESFRVYGREGQPCPDCAALIRKTVQQKRSTYYCPRCQKHG